MSNDKATSIFHLFVFVNYFTPLLGAWVSDKFFGRYNTILWVSLFYCLGHGVLATSDLFTSVDGKFNLLCVGLSLEHGVGHVAHEDALHPVEAEAFAGLVAHDVFDLGGPAVVPGRV